MQKIMNHEVVFREFPDETTLAVNFSGCPNNCPGCHSSYLAQDIGDDATWEYMKNLIEKYKDQITCVGLMGGDAHPSCIGELGELIHENYPELKIGWYSGKYWSSINETPIIPFDITCFNYIKLGPYVEELGGLDNKNTNQRMYMNTNNYVSHYTLYGWEDITYKFWK